jgi:hypothetical protein
MNISEELKRLELLFTVLLYCSKKGRFFTIGERICINQERALLIQDDYDFKNHNYQQPKAITNKIDFIVNKINATGWIPENI